MKLLSLEELRDGFDKEFLPLEPMLTGYRLKKGGLEENVLLQCEATLSISFPSDFRRLISEYDFGNLTIGPIAFCASGDYQGELLDFNECTRWWGSGERPANLIMIANSDPFAILLDVDTGEVLSMDAELGLHKSTVVSKTFENFLGGIGTTILLRNNVDEKEILAKSVHDAISSQSLGFWISLAK